MTSNKPNKIIDRLIEIIESNRELTWVNACKSHKLAPQVNGLSLNPYNGGNAFISYLCKLESNFTSNIWITFNQAKELDLKFIPKEDPKQKHKYCPIRYYSQIEKKDQPDEVKGTKDKDYYHLLKFSLVFNLDLFENCDNKLKLLTKYQNKYGSNIESLVNCYPIERNQALMHDHLVNFMNKTSVNYVTNINASHGSYLPCKHQITMPDSVQYRSYNDFLLELSHEVVHSTKSKLQRDFGKYKDSDRKSLYSVEELIAETSASIILDKFSLINESLSLSSACYLKSWLSAIKESPNFIYQIIGSINKATNYVLEDQAIIDQLVA